MNTRLLSTKCYTLIAAILCLLISTVSAKATTYYVNCSAATNGSGTLSSPWNNVLSASITYSAGDSLRLMRGTTCSGQELDPLGSGTSGSPITIDAYAAADPSDPSAAPRLSMARAFALRDALMACGIPSDSIIPRADGVGKNPDVAQISASP